MAKLVAIGDSLTQGFQSLAITHCDQSYPAMIADCLGLSPKNLQELNVGQKLEIQSRSGARVATVKVDRLNYTNTIAYVASGAIGGIDVADLVVGYK